MGCSGWIIDPNKPIEVESEDEGSVIICHAHFVTGNGVVDLERPIEGHENCLDNEGRLAITVEDCEIVNCNYQER